MSRAMRLSLVVPTRNEAENIEPLCSAVAAALGETPYELVFVDDSEDDMTVPALERAASKDRAVRFEHRAVSDGLSGAVLRGLALSRGEVVAVLDGDLQHPPEILPRMLARIDAGADLVVGSRFVPGGDDGGLGPDRRLVSFVARASIWAALNRTRGLHDPTTGCFMFRREGLSGARPEAVGWKVLLEVVQRGRFERIEEEPLRFAPRRHGVSKLGGRQVLDLYRQLWRLARASPDDRRLYLFALVGLSGVVVNMAVFLALSRAGLVPEAAAPVSAVAAMVSNFIWNERFTYRDRRSGQVGGRAFRAVATQAVGVGVDTGIVALAHSVFGLPGALANLLGILVAAGWNYGIFSTWVWRRAPRAPARWKAVPSEVSQKS